MPRDNVVAVAGKAWTQVTNGNMTKFSIKNTGREKLILKATVGATAPANTSRDGAPVEPKEAISAVMAEMFPGVAGANRLYIWSEYPTTVYISHD